MNDIERAVAALRADRTSGASALSRRLAEALAAFVREAPAESAEELARGLRAAARALAEARPSMRALANTAGLIALAAEPPLPARATTLRRRIGRVARQVLTGWDRAAEAIARQALGLLPDAILTHSYSSTVLAALLARRPGHVVACESRPLCEGRRLAGELAASGLRVSLITDGQAGPFMSSVRALLVGADAVLADGSVINKAGTALLALAARREGIPCYVAAETLKVCPDADEPSPPEEKEPAEVWPDAPPGLAVRNVYFDRTPPDLISAIITEDRVFRPDELAPLVERARAWARALARP